MPPALREMQQVRLGLPGGPEGWPDPERRSCHAPCRGGLHHSELRDKDPKGETPWESMGDACSVMYFTGCSVMYFNIKVDVRIEPAWSGRFCEGSHT